MKKAVVIGGSGHVGGYLVPRLVEAGYEVTNVSRGQHAPYRRHGAWSRVTSVTVDRKDAEAKGTFAGQIAALEPDVVLDMICFSLDSAKHLAQELTGKVEHLLVTGSIWANGPCAVAPTPYDQPRTPFGEYGIQKAAIEAYLARQSKLGRLATTVIHPGHIVGPGWAPVNPQGHFNTVVFETLARGQELVLPNIGMETVHHVHADDVAQLFELALANWSNAVGQSFYAVSPAAVTLRGYAETVACWFGQEANLDYCPLEAWRQSVAPEDGAVTEDHIRHSPCCSIAQAQRLLGYAPRYSSYQAVFEALAWLIREGRVDAPALGA